MAHSTLRDPWLPVYSVAVYGGQNGQSRLGLLHSFQCNLHHLASAVFGSDRGMVNHVDSLVCIWRYAMLTYVVQQLLHAEAVAIAKMFNGSAAQKYQAAAEQVRMP